MMCLTGMPTSGKSIRTYVALISVYVGIYFYAVYRGPVAHFGPSIPDAIVEWPARYGLLCPVGGNVFLEYEDACKRFFAPVHWADRKLRPDFWRSQKKGP
jgi:hypothetical protein